VMSSHDNTLPSDGSDAAHVASSVAKYKALFYGLLALTVLTVGVSYVHFGSNFWNFVVGMLIATLKAGLVAAIFMHLLGEKLTIWRFLIFTGVFVTGLFLLTLLAHKDPIPGTAHSSHSAKGNWHGADSISSPGRDSVSAGGDH
jgi:caa(3)-type oxidase subunit IV